MSAPRGRDGTPCRPRDALEDANAELQMVAQRGRHGVPSLPCAAHPKRKSLPHDVPFWINRDAAIFFITINCQTRGTNQLARDEVGTAMLESAKFYEDAGRWFVWLLLLMPDHLHALVNVPRAESLRLTVRAWKKHQATHLGVKWQRDFFDHRLRSDEGYDEKAAYIRMNPVRRGLVKDVADWRYVLDQERCGRTARNAIPTALRASISP